MPPPPGPTNAADRQLAWTLFAAFSCLYLFCSAGHFTAADAWQKFLALKAMLTQGTVFFPEGWTPGVGGQCSYFPIGASLIMLPGWLLGAALAPLVPMVPADFVARFFITLQNALISAGLVAATFVFARSLAYPVGASLYAAAALGLGSMVFPYAKSDWSEPACALMLVGACWLLLRASQEGLRAARPLLAAGALLALAFLTRNEMALIAPGALAWLAWRHRAEPAALGRAIGLMALPVAGAIALALAYNAARYGHPLIFQNWRVLKDVAPPPPGGWPSWALGNLWHYTLNPGDGLLWFSPVVLAGFAGMRAFWREHRDAATLLLMSLPPLFCFYWAAWGLPGWVWGMRFNYVFLPFLLLPAAAAWAAMPARRPLLRALLGVGLAVQLLGVIHNYGFLFERERERYPELPIESLMSIPRHAPLWLALRDTPRTLAGGAALLAAPSPSAAYELAETRLRAQYVPDLWWMLQLLTTFPRAITLGLAALLLVGLAAAVRRLRRLAATATEPGPAGMQG